MLKIFLNAKKKTSLVVAVVLILAISTFGAWTFVNSKVDSRNRNIEALNKKLLESELRSKSLEAASASFEDFVSTVSIRNYYPHPLYFTEPKLNGGEWNAEDIRVSELNGKKREALLSVTDSSRQNLVLFDGDDQKLLRRWADDTRDWLRALHFYKTEAFTYESNKINFDSLRGTVSEIKGHAESERTKIRDLQGAIQMESERHILFFF